MLVCRLVVAMMLCAPGAGPLDAPGGQPPRCCQRFGPVAPAPPDLYPSESPTAHLVAGGILYGAMGGLGGWLVGMRVTDSLEGGLTLAIAAQSILIPFGVHRANRSQGDSAPMMLVSAGLGAAGLAYGLSQHTDAAFIATSIATPVMQVAVSVLIERITSK